MSVVPTLPRHLILILVQQLLLLLRETRFAIYQGEVINQPTTPPANVCIGTFYDVRKDVSEMIQPAYKIYYVRRWLRFKMAGVCRADQALRGANQPFRRLCCSNNRRRILRTAVCPLPPCLIVYSPESAGTTDMLVVVPSLKQLVQGRQRILLPGVVDETGVIRAHMAKVHKILRATP